VALQAGTTYTIAFEVSGNNTSNGSSIQLGVYGGACATVSIAPDQCTIPSTVGFTTLATPSQGAAAGNPTPPPVTLVSETNLAPTSTSSTAYGTPVVVTRVVDGSTNNRVRFTVTRIITPVTTTPFTTTVVSTPHTLETYSDNSTVTTNGTATTTRTTGNTIVTGNSSTQNATAASNGLRDSMSYRNFNPFLVDVFSLKNGPWTSPYLGYAKMGGTVRSTGIDMGYNKIIDNNTFGFALRYEDANNHDYVNSTTGQKSYAGTVYVLSRQEKIWIKTSVGLSSSEYNSGVSIPSFNLSNNNKVDQRNVYGDITIYSAKDYRGVRPLFGLTLQNSNITGVKEGGSSLLSTAPNKGSTNEARPYAGIRYDYNDWLGAETRVTYSKNFNTVSQNKISVKKNITDNAYIELGTGFDKGSNYTAGTFSAGLRVNF
jgi:hypothetical protein